jgi:hypothetical protein
MAEKKRSLLRLDPKLHEKLEKWAADELPASTAKSRTSSATRSAKQAASRRKRRRLTSA